MFARHCATIHDRSQASATACNHPQPFATIRCCPCEAPLAVPMGSVAKVVTFGCVKRRPTSFRVAGATCFKTCQKSFCVTSAVLLHCFRKMTFTLETSAVILCGRRSALDVWFCLFLQIALSGLRQVVAAFALPGRRGIL